LGNKPEVPAVDIGMLDCESIWAVAYSGTATQKGLQTRLKTHLRPMLTLSSLQTALSVYDASWRRCFESRQLPKQYWR
jgi:hypothetical protein